MSYKWLKHECSLTLASVAYKVGEFLLLQNGLPRLHSAWCDFWPLSLILPSEFSIWHTFLCSSHPWQNCRRNLRERRSRHKPVTFIFFVKLGPGQMLLQIQFVFEVSLTLKFASNRNCNIQKICNRIRPKQEWLSHLYFKKRFALTEYTWPTKCHW